MAPHALAAKDRSGDYKNQASSYLLNKSGHYSLDSRLRGNKFLHPVCHSREGRNPEYLQIENLPRFIEKIRFIFTKSFIDRNYESIGLDESSPYRAPIC
jgi:hypothetical protein